ncbi:MAG: DUF1552 domain-containing protein, partial [Puniceicoccaceae bacterium]
LRAAERASPGRAFAPLRTAFVYVPNGVDNAHWWPSGSGTQFRLGESLRALEGVKSHLQFVKGLSHRKAYANGDGPGDHARASATFLTGEQARKTAGTDIRVGQSVDQMIAAHAGADYRLPSLELSCDPPRTTGGCDSGYSCAYQFNLSWRTENQPVPAERNPRLVFERLFGAGNPGETAEQRARSARRRQSILDFVQDDARRLQSRLGAEDRPRLDEYLTAVREIERRVESFDAFAGRPDTPLPAGVPPTYPEHMRLMFDLLILAFRTQSTPVATLLLSHEGSNRTFPQLGITEGHHSLSHHENRANKLEQIRRIDAFYAENFAYLIQRFRDTPDGEGSLLDNSLILYGSGIRDGNRHDHSNLPIILAGRAGGALTPGRIVDLGGRTPMTNLYLSMLGLHGVPAERIGDSTAPLRLI